MKPIALHGFSHHWLGVGMALVVAAAAPASTLVTFQIDMASETATPTLVTIAGSFNGWSYQNPSWGLVNAGGTIWTNTFTISDPPGTVESCKFIDNVTGWESIPNRQFILGGYTQVLPLTEWNTNDWPGPPTNQVTFQVNMSEQIYLGNFTNGDPHGSITVSGDFEGWDNGIVLTNNPTLSDQASNVYVCVAPIVGYPGSTTIRYKFRMNGGWESGNNRTALITNANQVLPLVYYNDYRPTIPIRVTFSIVVTNGTLDDAGVPFIKGIDTLWINGDFLGWWLWKTGVGGGAAAGDQMVEVGSSDTYTNSFLVQVDNFPFYMNYKYSVDEFDDENGFGTNHVREIRSWPTYVCPTDVWSWTVLQPDNGNPYTAGLAPTNIIEPDFGYLTIGKPSGGNVPITWLGRPGVVLENESSLTSGSWTTSNGTSGTQSTNWPVSGGNQFFRLMTVPVYIPIGPFPL